MPIPTCFEMLPDEMILNICEYLRGADVFYSFYNLNNRLNITIEGYCRYVNLMAVSYKQFEYAVLHVLPQIGSSIRSFVLNGNWETIINTKISLKLFSSNLLLLFPQIQRLTIKWFTSQRLLSFIDIIDNFPALTELDIRFLKGNSIDLIQSKVLSANNNRLAIVTFDQDSTYFDINDSDTNISYPNIHECTINLTESKLIPRLFQLLPNVFRLHVNTDELSNNSKRKPTIVNLTILNHLIDFQLRSINLFWTFDEIKSILKSMPRLEKLALDLRTDDVRLVTEEDFSTILPSTINKIDYFIRYYYPKLRSESEVSMTFSSKDHPIACLLDKPRERFLIHTIPCDLHSLILTATISKQMLFGWKYTQHIKDLYIYDITSLSDILLILQHFRQLRILSIDIKDKNETLTLPSDCRSIEVKLPHLKQIEISGKCEIYSLLNGSPNVDYLVIYYDCLEILLDDEATCQLLKSQILRLNVIDWKDINSNRLEHISQIFSSLRHLVITMEDPKLLIEDFLLKIFSLWKDKSRLSIDIKGSLAEQTKENLRQWLIEHSHIKEEDTFALEYNDNWFDFWF